MMVLYDFDANAILATGIKSRKKEHLLEGFKEGRRELIDAGIVPQLVKLDNEASAEMIKTIKKEHFVPIGPTKRPQNQPSGTIHQNLQGSFNCNSILY